MSQKKAFKEKSFGKYTLLSQIARGGMGEVFKARHVEMKSAEPVALKRILKHASKDSGFVRMFFREAKIISSLNHPNLIKVKDFGKEQGSFYMTMEYIDGMNLDALLKKVNGESKNKLPLFAAIEIVRQALSGINSAHEAKDQDGISLGIVHLDLSTHNLMIDKSGNIKIIDFGISKAVYEENHKVYNILCGTYAYMSPEQCKEKDIDLRSDIYTLGILLYELTTNSALFSKHPTEFMILKAITDGMIPPPSNVEKNYPKGLEEVVYKALAVDKDERYQTANEFLTDLNKVSDTYNFKRGADVLLKALNEIKPDFFTHVENETEEKPANISKEEKITEKSADKIKNKEDGKEGRADNLSTANTAKQKDKTASKSKQEKTTKAKTKTEPSTKGTQKTKETTDEQSPVVDSMADQLEFEMQRKRQNSVLYTLVAVLVIAITAAFSYQYHLKTGWIKTDTGTSVYMPESGDLLIDTNPVGAIVFINKKQQLAQTPLQLDHMELDEDLKIEIILPGYESIARKIKLTSKSPLEALVFDLKKI